MKKILSIYIIFLLFFFCDLKIKAATVKVGGYIFPPFIEEMQDNYFGMALDLIEAMNKFQDKYKFQFVLTSSKRRYIDFETKRYDMILFESINWGWKDKDIQASKVFLKGGEVYITIAKPTKNQNFFNNLKNKSIGGYLGYHYGFANFNADEDFLKKSFNIELTTSHERNIKKVILERIDIAVITKSYLNNYIIRNPYIKNKILISDKLDQEYNHTILVRKNIKPGIKEINELLTNMKTENVLSDIWKKYGIE